MIRAVIAEDEPLAVDKLRALVSEEEDLELVAVAHNGAEAAELVDRLKPDLLFLDVRMPGVSGIETLDRINHKPAVIFTTAYDQYALAAFELAAVDYLLKPFGQQRFREALQRARRHIGQPNGATPIERVAETMASKPLTRLFVREKEALRPLSVSAVDRFEAMDDYVAVHTGTARYLISISLQELERRLPADQFLRIHRSHMINLDRIKAIHPNDGARMIVELSTGAQIAASKSGSQRLRELVR